MKTYELIYLISSINTEDQAKALKEQVEELLKKEEADVLYHKVWKRTKLAYKIKQLEHAYYMVVFFNTGNRHINSITRKLTLMKDIVRSRIFTCDNLERQVKYFIEDRPVEERKPKPMIAADIINATELQVRRRVPIPTTRKAIQEDKAEVQKQVGDGGKKDIKEEDIKQVKKATLGELDERLKDILEGEIEL